MMKELLTIENELKAIQETGNEKVAEYELEIQTAINNEEEANREVIKTKQGDDPKAYAKAIADKRTASDIASYYKGKIEALKNEPYITSEEYREYSNRIKQEMNEVNEQASNRASELIEELEEIQNELIPAHVKTNQLLSNLQNNIYKHSSEKQMKIARDTGKSIVSSELNNEYKDNAVKSGIDYILNSHAAKNIKGGNR